MLGDDHTFVVENSNLETKDLFTWLGWNLASGINIKKGIPQDSCLLLLFTQGIRIR